MDDSTLAMLGSIGSIANDVMTSVVLGNVGTNLVLSSAMGSLWVLVNALQILVHLPVFQITIPLNSKLMFAVLLQITNFELLPTDSINQDLLQIDDSNPFEDLVNENLLDMDIF